MREATSHSGATTDGRSSFTTGKSSITGKCARNSSPWGTCPCYELSGIFFYTNFQTNFQTNRTALILNGRQNNLEYGSYAPDAPHVFIGDAGFVSRWKSADRWYVVSEDEKRRHLVDMVGDGALHVISRSGGKTVYVNR